jgi:hypothetical protein
MTAAAVATDAVSGPAFSLPASIRGTLPCPDCARIRARLDLWPEGIFRLQRAFVGQRGSDDDLGRRGAQPHLVLRGREARYDAAVGRAPIAVLDAIQLR